MPLDSWEKKLSTLGTESGQKTWVWLRTSPLTASCLRSASPVHEEGQRELKTSDTEDLQGIRQNSQSSILVLPRTDLGL